MWLKKKKKITPTVYTEEMCPRCGNKNKRNFDEGDYIYKIGSNCKRCSELTMISAIYGEYPMEKKQKQSQEL
jgi:hypothetical protein